MRAAAAARNEYGLSGLRSIEAELQETKKNLEQAQQEQLEMAKKFASLKQELERTKEELRQLKEMEKELSDVNEDIKFRIEDERPMVEFHKKRCVTFAHPPSFAQVVNTEQQLMQRQYSLDRETTTMKMMKKKKPLIPYMGVIFNKKKA